MKNHNYMDYQAFAGHFILGDPPSKTKTRNAIKRQELRGLIVAGEPYIHIDIFLTPKDETDEPKTPNDPDSWVNEYL